MINVKRPNERLAPRALGLLFLLACTLLIRYSADSSQPLANSDQLLWRGCDEVELPQVTDRAPICILRTGPGGGAAYLWAWLPEEPDKVSVLLDGQKVDVLESERLKDGTFIQLSVRHDGRLRIEGGQDDRDQPEHLLELSVQIRPIPLPKFVKDQQRANDDDKQQQLITELTERLGSSSVEDKIYILEQLWITLYRMGRYAEAHERAREQAELARERGWYRRACRGVFVAAHLLGEELGEPERESELLDGDYCLASAWVPAENRWSIAYYRGLLALNQGHLRRAITRFNEAISVAQRLRWDKGELLILQPLVDVFATQGRFLAAKRLLERIAVLRQSGGSWSSAGRCEVDARSHEKRGELAFRALLAGNDDFPWMPEDEWGQAIEVYADRERCSDSKNRTHVAELYLDLARVALERGQHDYARVHLQQAERQIDEISDSKDTEIWVRYQLAMVESALAADHRDGVDRRLEDIGRRLSAPHNESWLDDQRWRYHLLRSRVFERRGGFEQALSALDRADEVLLRVQRGISGALLERDRYSAMHRASGSARVRLLLARGDLKAARCAARLARAQSVIDFARPSEDTQCTPLEEPDDGEAAILYHYDGGHLTGFAWRRGETPVVRELGAWNPTKDADYDRLGEQLLLPFESVLSDVTRLRLLLAGPLTSVSFEALKWRGQSLIDSMAVTYAIDIRPPPPAANRRARLVFAAVQLRLEKYLREVEYWMSLLAQQGAQVDILEQRGLETKPISSPQMVFAHVENAGLAVLFGTGRHGASIYDKLIRSVSPEVPPIDDIEPDEFGFELEGVGLMPDDVLHAKKKAPQRIVLAACNTARTDELGAAGTSGLAQSFVINGSLWAVGATTLVEEKSAVNMVGALLEHDVMTASAAEIAAALRQVQRRLRARGDRQWAEYHVWVP
ncbi:MAG: CHAT domain-containing protein [Myxococcota bacterium]